MLIPVLMFSFAVMSGQDGQIARQISEATMPLPDALRGGATVILEATPGKRVVLRAGTNGLICRANTVQAGFRVYCYAQEMDAFWTRYEQLASEGKTNTEIRDALAHEAAAGRLENRSGTALYTMSGDSAESSLPLMAIFLPNATPQSTGLPTERDHYRPWLMWAGTPFAHVMIPGK